VTDIRDEFNRVIEAGRRQTAFLAQRLDEWGVSILNAVGALALETPTRIIQTSQRGSTVTTTPPTQPITLAQGQTDTIAITLADANGNAVAGAVLDPGATVTVSDGTAATAVLSADQSSVLVTPLPAGGTAVAVQVNGTFNGATLTPDPTTYDVTAAATAVPTQIVQTPGTPT
jgi:hypothetical protein